MSTFPILALTSLLALAPGYSWAQSSESDPPGIYEPGPKGDWAGQAKKRFQMEHPDIADQVRRRSGEGVQGSAGSPPAVPLPTATMGGSSGARPPLPSQVQGSPPPGRYVNDQDLSVR